MARCRYWSLAERARSIAAATPPPGRSAGAAALFLRPPPDPLAVAPRGGAQFQFRIDTGRTCPGHEREQRRADLADHVAAGAVIARTALTVADRALAVGAGPDLPGPDLPRLALPGS